MIDLDKVIHDTYYDPETGRLYRVKELCTISDNGECVRARNIMFNGAIKQSTHIMFFIMTGRWPELGKLIDHKDGNVYDSSWANLREATYSQNMANRASLGRMNGNDEGLEKGVSKNRNTYHVKINSTCFGYYKTVAEANAVARQKRAELQGEFQHRPSWRRM